MAPKNVYTVQFDLQGKATGLLNAIKQAQGAFNNMKIEPKLKNKFTSQFSEMERDLSKVLETLDRGITNASDMTAMDKNLTSIFTKFNKIRSLMEDMGMDPNKLIPSSTISGLDNLEDSVDNIIKAQKEQIANDTKLAKLKKEQAKNDALLQDINKRGVRRLKTSNNPNAETIKKDQKFYKDQLDTQLKKLSTLDIDTTEYKKLQAEIEITKTKLAELHEEEQRPYKISDKEKALQNQTRLAEEINELEQNGQTIEKERAAAVTEWQTQYKKLGGTKEVTNNFKEETIAIKEHNAELAMTNYGRIVSECNNIGNALETTEDAFQRNIAPANEFNRSIQDLESIRNRVNDIFSFTGALRVLERVVRSAFSTVKELDAAMTETAVVTDNTVGDMWSQLDQYTAKANELGATTKGAYETMTLYYQQGLNDQEAWDLGVETMKMARIANMDYTKATDAMTAAVRGFNMELNAVSGQRINDVYSELAAKTASNTKEISTAMEKVASLASNAGMDLETTAVYLSQAIETTREAPENIGTAMKTILARFQALTKDPDELSIDAQEALNGETVDANVTEAALRKAGVALRDETGQFRDAKDVLLELNSVWDTLDKNTQRYIATQTAGSRQQSRFIAMMQDYGRTQELLGYAQNSTGASQKQFEKTQESLEAKLNKLTNAWNEFTMGIGNSTMIKTAVDLMTKLLSIINKLTGSFGPFISIITKGALAFATWRTVPSILNRVFDSLLMLTRGPAARGTFRFDLIAENILQSIRNFNFGNISKVLSTRFKQIFNDTKNILANAGTDWTLGWNLADSKKQFEEYSSEILNQKNKINEILNNKQLSSLEKNEKISIANAEIQNLNNQKDQLINQYKERNIDLGTLEATADIELNANEIDTDSIIENINDVLDSEHLETLQLEGDLSEVGGNISGPIEQVQSTIETVQDAGEQVGTVLNNTSDTIETVSASTNAAAALETAASQGVVDATLQETAAKITNTEAIILNEKARLLGIDSESEEAIAKQAKIAQLSTENAQLAANTGEIVTNSGATTVNTGTETVNTGSIIANTAARIKNTIATIAANPALLAIAAAAAIVTLSIKAETDAIDRATKSIETYNDTTSKINSNLDTVADVKDEFNELAQGVNDAGKNIGLSTEQFSRYHEIVNQLVEISPSLVQGYDSEGNAIIDKTNAVRDLIDAENEELEIANKKFASTSNLSDLIIKMQSDSRDLDITGEGRQGYAADSGNTNKNILARENSYLERRNELLNKIQEQEDKIDANTADISNRTDQKQKLAEYKQELELLEDTHKKAQDLIPLYSDIQKSLSIYIDELRNGSYVQNNFSELLSAGIEEISMSGQSATEMQSSVDDLVKSLYNSRDVLIEYKRTTRDVTSAQEDFLQSAQDDKAIDDYNKSITTTYDKLIELADSFESTDKTIADAMRSSAESIKSFASESKKSLSEVLNPFQSAMRSAEGLGSILEDVEEHDYYAVADGMSEVLDTALNSINADGKGSISFWTTALSYLNDEFLASTDYSFEAAKSKLQELQQMTAEGSSGAIAFQNYYQSKLKGKTYEDGTSMLNDKNGLHFDISNIDELAKALDLNVQATEGLINKYSQYVEADWTNNPQQMVSAAKNEGLLVGENKNAPGIWQEDLVMAATQAGADITDSINNWENKVNGTILSVAGDSGTELAEKLIKLGFKGSEKNTVDGDKLVASMVAQGKTSDEIHKAVSKIQNEYTNGIELSDDVDNLIDEAEIANAILNDPVANIVQNDVVSRLDQMLVIMGQDKTLLDNGTGYTTQKDKKTGKTKWETKSETDLINDNTDLSSIKQEISNAETVISTYQQKKANGHNLTDDEKTEYKAAKKVLLNEQQALNNREFANKSGVSMAAANALYGNKEDIWNLTKKNGGITQEELVGQLSANNQQLWQELSSAEKKAITDYYNNKIKNDQEAQRTEDASKFNFKNYKDSKATLDANNTTNSELAKYSQNFKGHEQQVIDIFANVADNDLIAFSEELKELPDEVETQITTDFPGLQTLKDYETEISQLKQKDQEVVINTVMSGDFTTDEWKQFAEKQPELAVGIQFETQKLQGLDEIEVPGKLQISDKDMQAAVEGAQAKIDAYYVNAGQEPPEPQETKVNYKRGTQEGPKAKTATVNYTGGTQTVTVKLKEAKASGQNLQSAAVGKNLGSASKGAKRGKIGPSGNGGLTLTGELGPELVWEPDKGYSYITGENGPEMRNLSKNAVVWPAEQTKEIMSSAATGKNIFGSAADFNPMATDGGKNKKSSKNSSKDSSSKSKDWENEYKRWYNIAKDVEKLIRKADKLEDKYDEYLRDMSKTGKDTTALLNDLFSTYQSTISNAESIMSQANAQANALNGKTITYYKGGEEKKKNKRTANLASYVSWDDTNKKPVINWDAINSISDSALYDEVKKYIDEYEDLQSEYEKYEDEKDDALKAIKDLQQKLIDNASDSVKTFAGIFEELRQAEIDSLEKVNDTISDANTKLIDAINKSIDKLRQARDNKNTEDDLAKKRAQLEVLKRDTSGASDVRIKQLEKEIRDAEQDYKDTLVDQSVANLEDQVDEATQQRQQMIDILQAQLDWDKNSGKINEDTQLKILQYTDNNGTITEEGWDILRQSQEYQQANALERIEMEKDWAAAAKSLYDYSNTNNSSGQTNNTSKSNALSNLSSNGRNVIVNGQTLGGANVVANADAAKDKTNVVYAADEYGVGSIVYKDEQGNETIYSSYTDAIGNIKATENKGTVEAYKAKLAEQDRLRQEQDAQAAAQAAWNAQHPWGYVLYAGDAHLNTSDKNSNAVRALQNALNYLIGAGLNIDGNFGPKTENAVKAYQRSRGLSVDGKAGPKTQTQMYYEGFKTGGIADYTGPAWLDGTPTKPELVLNATDTANFIKLKDILGSLLKGDISSTIPNGDMTVNINIDVEQMANDYDAEKLADKIKKEIVKDSRYRNVNTLRRK